MGKKSLEGLLELFGGRGVAMDRPGPLDHCLGALADQPVHVLIGDMGMAAEVHDVVEARDQIGSGVDQCSIKIEYNQVGSHALSC
jgi:hypothetical protein